MKRALRVLALIFTLVAAKAFPATLLDQGIDALRNNDAAGAKTSLLAALNQNPQDERIYLYLGVADMQLGDYNGALEVLKQGLTVSQQYTYAFYFDIGNIYFMQGQNMLAEGMYSKAIQKDPNFADAFLNRANARMRLNSLDGAAADYTTYLGLAPNSPQRENIQKLLALLDQAKVQARQEQLATEKKKQEDEARQKALLNEVMQNLQSASSNTTNLQAGTASIQDTKPKLGLDD